MATAAQAGSAVELPPSEDESHWVSALEFAGLDSPNDEGPRIRVEVLLVDRWLLRAEDERGTFRTAEVARPRTAEEREEVALIAGGLLRAMVSAAAPPLPAAMPPPPPPPAPASSSGRARESAVPPAEEPQPGLSSERGGTGGLPRMESVVTLESVPDGSSSPRVPSVVQSPDETLPDRLDWLESGRPAAQPSDREGDSDLASVASTRDRSQERRTGRKRVALNPLQLGSGVGLRPNARMAGYARVGTRLWRMDRWTVNASLSLVAPHDLLVMGASPNLSSVDLDLDATWRAGRRASLGPLAGLSYRTINQQGADIGRITMPVVGAHMTLTPLGGSWWAVCVHQELRVDMGVTQLIPATGPADNMSVFAGRVGLSLVFGDQVDPFRPVRTSKRR